MERVSEIRADIAENAAHVNNKMLLVELREVSRLFAERCERVDKDEFDLEVFERVGIVRVAARAEDAKRIHSLFDCARLIQSTEWKNLKDLSQRKTSGGWLMMDPLSKAEAERLFKENAVLMGGNDGLPVQIAEEFLSEEAINTTKGLRNARGKLYDAWCNGCGQRCEYLTETGFFMAVTLHNVGLLGVPQEDNKQPRLYVISNSERSEKIKRTFA